MYARTCTRPITHTCVHIFTFYQAYIFVETLSQEGHVRTHNTQIHVNIHSHARVHPAIYPYSYTTLHWNCDGLLVAKPFVRAYTTYTHARAHVRTCTHTRRMYPHVHTHTHTHTSTYTYTRTHMHTHEPMRITFYSREGLVDQTIWSLP